MFNVVVFPTVRAEKTVYMTLLDLETQVINGRNITITFRQVLNRYHIYLPPILAFYGKLLAIINYRIDC